MEPIVKEYDIDSTLEGSWEDFYDTNTAFLIWAVLLNSGATFMFYWWYQQLSLALYPELMDPQDALEGDDGFYSEFDDV